MTLVYSMPVPKTSWYIALMGHFAMGAIMGMLLSLSLIVGNYAHLLEMIENSAAPRSMLLTVVAALSSILAVGTSLTGFLFTAVERSRSNF